jgi:hypothetical protein
MSVTQMAKMAIKIVKPPSAVSLPNTTPTISLVNPNVSRDNATMRAPPMMKGRRRPHFDVHESDMAPTMGCVKSPERGPAIQTRDVLDFVRPRFRRYGVQSSTGMERVSAYFRGTC